MATKILGISYPLSNEVGANFKMTTTTIDQMRANLKVLLNTEKGERYLMPTFGVEKKKWVFENFTNNSQDLDDLIIDSITEAINTWLPNLELGEITVDKNIDEHYLSLQIPFNLKNNVDEKATETFNLFF